MALKLTYTREASGPGPMYNVGLQASVLIFLLQGRLLKKKKITLALVCEYEWFLIK